MELFAMLCEKYGFDPLEDETVRAEFECGSVNFTVSGKSVTRNGWRDLKTAFRHSYKTEKDKEKEENKPPELSEGMEFAIERAGTADTGEDAERKGLGMPATRADIIEKLVNDGFVERRKKQLVPTEDGIKLIGVLPDAVKSPQLTADWENALALVAKGELPMREFMGGIKNIVKGHVQEFGGVSEEKGLNGRKGSYDVYLIPEGVKEYSYMRDGKELKGFQYQLKLEFPQGKQTSRKRR